MSDFFPTVSIIVPVYNGSQVIENCIVSLLAQNYPADRFEVIIVENGCNDDTAAIVQRYPVRLMQCFKRGPAPARNLGITSSQAEIIAFTDADCIADPDWLRNLILPYRDSRVGAVAGKINAYIQQNGTFADMFSAQFPPLINYISGEHEYLPHLYTANASYRREPLLSVGCFHPDLVTGEDVDLSWRFQLQTGMKVAYVENAVVYHRHRTTLEGLYKQYRQYGYGEIILDTLYSTTPGYPRSRAFQVKRILSQIMVLPRYMASSLLRHVRLALGKASPFEAALPGIWMRVESANIRGKLDAWVETSGMRHAALAIGRDPEAHLDLFY